MIMNSPRIISDTVRESEGRFRRVPYDTMDAAGIFDHDLELYKYPEFPPEGLEESRALHLHLLFDPYPENGSIIPLIELKRLIKN
jgi:hypothetical protein